MHLVIFDCDGTLIDSQKIIVAAMERAFSGAGLAAPERAGILSVVGLSLEGAVARLAPGLDAADVHALADAYREGFSELRADPALSEPFFPGAREALDALGQRDDVLIGMATGKSRRGVAHLIEREGLHGRFVTIQTSDDHPSKPHPSMVEQAIAETGSRAERTVVVGDTTYDVEMARAAGAGALGVSWGYHEPKALEQAGAEHILDHFDALIPWLERRWPALAGERV